MQKMQSTRLFLFFILMQQQNKQTNYLIKIRMFELCDLRKAEKNKFLKLKKNNLNYTIHSTWAHPHTPFNPGSVNASK